MIIGTVFLAAALSFSLVWRNLSENTDDFRKYYKPIVAQSLNNGSYLQIGLDIESLQKIFDNLDSYGVYTYYNGYDYLSGDEDIRALLVDRDEPHWTEFSFPLDQLLVLKYEQNRVLVVLKFRDKYFTLRFLLCFFGLIGILSFALMIHFNKSHDLTRKYLNWCFHEMGYLIDFRDRVTVLKKRTCESVALLLPSNFTIRKPVPRLTQYTPKLSTLIDLLFKGYSGGKRPEYRLNHRKGIYVEDAPLSLALSNVIRNAGKYTTNGRIRINTSSTETKIFIEITNYVGEILSPEGQRRMNNPKSTDQSGLNMTRVAVKALKGSIKNKFSDNETSVLMEFPLSSIERDYDEIKFEYSHTPRIAVIDDLRDCRESIIGGLKDCGFETRGFSHVEHFYREVKNGEQFELVLVDRYGTEHEDSSLDDWEAIQNGFAETAKKSGYYGPIILISQGIILPKKGGDFVEVLAKHAGHDWRNIVNRVLNNTKNLDKKRNIV